MARHARLIVPGVALHITQRANEGAACFRSDADRLTYLGMLRDLCAHVDCALHAYCLMTNHVHLLLTPPSSEACSILMHDVAGCYSAYFNRRHDRSGVLWQGRFYSCVVDSAAYVVACYRYIELNPLRAHMVGSPDAYVWSSYRGNAGLITDGSLLPHAEYAALADDPRRRGAAYRALFERRIDETAVKTIRSATRSGYPLVGEALKATLKSMGVRVEPGKRGPRPADVARVESLELGLAE